MSNKQLIVLWVGVGLIVAMCLWPPWVEHREGYDYRTVGYKLETAGLYVGHVLPSRTSLGYKFIFSPPQMRRASYVPAGEFMTWDTVAFRDQQGKCYLDISRLVVQCVVVALLTVTGIYTLRTKGK